MMWRSWGDDVGHKRSHMAGHREGRFDNRVCWEAAKASKESTAT